jgi:hypothetical protein
MDFIIVFAYSLATKVNIINIMGQNTGMGEGVRQGAKACLACPRIVYF